MTDHKPSADARPGQDRRRAQEKLAELEACYRHALFADDGERQELRDRIRRIHRRLTFGLGE